MKILLSLSLILNAVLGYLLLNQETPEVRERLIIETHSEPGPQKIETRGHVVESVPRPKVTPRKKSPPHPVGHVLDETSYQEFSEKMESDRSDFLQNELGLSQEVLDSAQSLKLEYFQKISAYYQKSPGGEPSFEDRRKIINLEESLHRDLARLMGQKKWERYQKFRENYNKASLKRQRDDHGQENAPYIFMGL